jgi:hypothetical protein
MNRTNKTCQLVLTFVLLLPLGCFSLGGSPSSADIKAIKSTIGGCSPTPCIAVDLAELPQIPSQVSSKGVRDAISTELRRVLYSPLDVEGGEPTKERLLGELEARLNEYQDVSDTPVEWSLTRGARVLLASPKVVSFEVTNLGYLGGAHGFNERTLLSFDVQSGRRLALLELIDERSRGLFSKIVEAEFRRVRSIRVGETLNDAGFFILPGQELPLGENFALTEGGIELQYNPYEVAPYSFGSTVVTISKDVLEPLLANQWR